MEFRSKVDRWFVVALIGSAVASTWAAGAMLSRPPGAGVVPVALAIALVAIGAGLPLWLLLSTAYVVDAGELRVRSGPFRWRIPLASVTGITPSGSLLSSPALSIDRLRIDYGRGKSLLVSPRDRAAFLRAIDDARTAAG